MLTLALASVVLGVPRFYPAGDLPGGGFLSELHALAADGSIAVGRSVVGGSGFSPVTDPCAFSPLTGLRDLGVLGTTAAYGVSANGSAVAGIADFGAFDPRGTQAFVWTEGSGIQLLGDLPGGSTVPHSGARGISRDGMMLAGTGESVRGSEAFRYAVSDGTFEPLGALAAAPFGSFAYGISGDGETIVGISYDVLNRQQAFRWTRSSGMMGMGFVDPPAGITPFSAAYAVNGDGAVIVGQTRSPNSGQGGEAYRWTASGGMQVLGDLPGGGFQSWAYGVSADGAVVVGRGSIQGGCGIFGCGSAPHAFVWDARHGMRDLAELLTAHGVDLTGWRLDEARGVSADGRFIVGIGLDPQSQVEGWMVDLAELACRGDFNDDGVIDLFDYLDFVSAFAAGGTGSDFNIDGTTDLFDYLDFLLAFEQGC